jgi:formamidopyrimidine-DNA glycosylase
MPELPEVETVVRGLRAAGIEGARIAKVLVRRSATVLGMSVPAFARALRGRTVVRLHRRAKYIVADLDDGGRLLIHLRMTGQLRFEPAGAAPDPHDRVILRFADGRGLHFHDTRAFGRVRLADGAADLLPDLGPEPLDPSFTAARLAGRLRPHRRRIKPLLLDQRCLAGLGNIYVDESLWAARIHPERRADTLHPAEIRRLHAAIRDVLRRAVRARGTSLGRGATNFRGVAGKAGGHAEALRVFRRAGQPCPRCGCPIERLRVAQRGTHVCPRCQARASATLILAG